jgi:hypothetical protein
MQTGITEKNHEKSLMSTNKVLCPQNFNSTIKQKLHSAFAFYARDAFLKASHNSRLIFT